MLSRITIELDFNSGKPYIRVINNKQSDDVKDKLISFFREQFGHTSNWCRVINFGNTDGNNFLFELHPIPPHELKRESELITEQAKLIDQHPQEPSIVH